MMARADLIGWLGAVKGGSGRPGLPLGTRACFRVFDRAGQAIHAGRPLRDGQPIDRVRDMDEPRAESLRYVSSRGSDSIGPGSDGVCGGMMNYWLPMEATKEV